VKILLIRPRDEGSINTRLPESLDKRRGILPPLGISYIASTLEKAGHTVKILDAIALNLAAGEIRRNIEEFKPHVVGITAMTSTVLGALESAAIAKEFGSITVLGGPQLSIYSEETLSYPYVNYGINGEGEAAMAELVNALENGKPIDSIQGLIYKKDGKVHINEPAIIADLDSLPFPAYHLLPMKKYDSIIGLYPVSTMISTRGCPYKCHFCFKQPSDDKFRYRSPKNVVDEMAHLVERYRVREIMFYDDVLTLRRAHIAGICEEILRRDLHINWEAPTRVDTIDKPLLTLMQKAGCIRLRYGVESGDKNILKLMNKKIDLAQAKEVFKWTKEAGIETFAYFMIGYAHENTETIKHTIDFCIELDPGLAMFTVVTPYPNTPLYELAKREGLIKNDYWREFTLGKIKNERIPYFVPDAEHWAKKAYRRFYFRPGYILKRLGMIHSWGDFTKCVRAVFGILGMK
jgi:anaerobic magnesium-protoporphyrin IX monomethyl ester cyclase